MKKSATWNRLLSVVLTLAMLLSLAAPALAAENDSISFTKVDNSSVKNPLNDREAAEMREEKELYAAGDVVRVSIFLNKLATIHAGFEVKDIAANDEAMAYRDGLEKDQNALVQKIEKATGEDLDVVWNLTLAANLISANVKYGQIEAIEAVKGVEKVVIETQYTPDVVSKNEADPNMATSGKQIGSAAAWAAGYTGAGSKIAIIDTGLDLNHEAFDADAFDYSLSLLDGEYDLMTKEDIAAVLNELHIAQFGATADELYANSKVPFAFSYIDEDLDVSHYDSAHGSHVAGIAAANAYVAVNNTYKPALQTTGVQGVAPDAQLLVMQVFGDGGGAYDSDNMAAIEDAIVLGADSVNLSLGSVYPGMSRSADYQNILDSLTESGVTVVMSAGNSGGWSDATPYGYLYIDDVSMHTGGSPGTYTNSLGVASVNNDGSTAFAFEVAGLQIIYQEGSGGNQPLSTLAGEQEFVFIDGLGKPEDWAAVGAALEGKVAFCSRGETSFYEKANAAVEAGAIAVVVYNNQPGILGMTLTGYSYDAPVVSITQNAAAAIKSEATAQDGYYTGKMTIHTGPSAVQNNSEYYTMSDFSSWGVPGSLTMKPEITAPGGAIYSAVGYDKFYGGGGSNVYESWNGTSMAAPQVAGMVAVLTQYFRESGLAEKANLDARTLAQSLLMSTAVPMFDGNSEYYYPVLQQGAGLANVGNAVAADSYILMGEDATASYADGKVKAELGDDPDRTGVYTFSFTINNITDEAKTYALNADVFTQGAISDGTNLYMDRMTSPMDAAVTWKINGAPVLPDVDADALDFNGDGAVTDADGEAILEFVVGNIDTLSNQDKADLNGDGEITTYDAYLFFAMAESDVVVVEANDSATVEVTIALSEEEKAFLDAYYTSGAYVQAYVYAEGVSDEEGVEGTSHSIPVLGFYGSWTDASMFDKGSFVEYQYGLENRRPYLYNQNGIAGNSLLIVYDDDPTSAYHFGGNPAVADETYMPERNAISAKDMLYRLQFANIRNAGEGLAYIKDTDTDEYLWTKYTGEVLGAFYFVNNGTWEWTDDYVNLGLSVQGVPENTALELGLTLIPEYYITEDGVDLDALGAGATLSFPFVVDNSTPQLAENGLKLSDDKKSLLVTASDNQYVAAVALLDAQGQSVLTYTGSDPSADKGEASEFVLDISEVVGSGFLLQLHDYANNVVTYQLNVQLGELVDFVDGVEISKTELVMQKGTDARLTANVKPANASDRSVTWSSSDEAVAKVNADGVVTAVAVGNATITATSNLDPTKSASCAVEVIDISEDMNAIVWDEEGSIWYSEFNTANLPNYEKLSADLLDEDYFVAATLGPDGVIYASSLDTSKDTGALYTIDPETYAVTKLSDCLAPTDGAPVHIFFSDLTYAPAMFGTGMLLGTYGPYVMAIVPETGEILGIIDEFESELVGIATCYGEYDPEYGEYQDVVYLIQNDGTVIQEIYFGYDGIVVPMMYYFYGMRAEFDSGVDVGDAWFYNSAYYDGTYLYWSAFNQNTDDEVTLYAIDADFTGETYTMGTFPVDVWPVGGLHQKDRAPYMQMASEGSMDEIRAMVAEKGMPEAEQFQLVKRDVAEKAEVKGGLNSVSNYQAPAQLQNVEDENTVTVTVTAKDAEGVEVDSTNGLITVTYDPTVLTLKQISVSGQYSAINSDEDGKVVIAYVGPDAIPAGEDVAELVFVNNATEDEQIVIEHEEYADKKSGYTETVDVEVAVQWHSASTTLSGNIGLNFYVKLAEELVNDESTFVRFSFAGKTLDVPMSAAVEAERDGETVYRFTCPVTSKNMTDVVTAQVMTADGAVGKSASTSVKTYCEYMIANSDDADVVALMKAMLNYGASAQVLFDYKTDDLANASLSAADKALATADVSDYAYTVTGSEAGIALNQATLVLDSETAVRVYFELTGDKTIDQYTFTVDGQKVTPVAKDGMYYLEVKNVGAHELDEMYTFAFGGLSVKFGALSFVNMVVEDPDYAGEALVNVANALFAYSVATENYIK